MPPQPCYSSFPGIYFPVFIGTLPTINNRASVTSVVYDRVVVSRFPVESGHHRSLYFASFFSIIIPLFSIMSWPLSCSELTFESRYESRSSLPDLAAANRLAERFMLTVILTSGGRTRVRSRSQNISHSCKYLDVGIHNLEDGKNLTRPLPEGVSLTFGVGGELAGIAGEDQSGGLANSKTVWEVCSMADVEEAQASREPFSGSGTPTHVEQMIVLLIVLLIVLSSLCHSKIRCNGCTIASAPDTVNRGGKPAGWRSIWLVPSCTVRLFRTILTPSLLRYRPTPVVSK